MKKEIVAMRCTSAMTEEDCRAVAGGGRVRGHVECMIRAFSRSPYKTLLFGAGVLGFVRALGIMEGCSED